MGTGHAGAEVHHCWVYAEHREVRINARSESPLRAFFASRIYEKNEFLLEHQRQREIHLC